LKYLIEKQKKNSFSKMHAAFTQSLTCIVHELYLI